MDRIFSESSQKRTDSNRISNQPHLFIRVAPKPVKEWQGVSSVAAGSSATDANLSNANSFHRAIRSVLVIAQTFALLPVEGIMSPNAVHLRFRWFNWRMIYTLWTQLCYITLILTYLYIQHHSEEKSLLKKYMIVVFLGCGLSNSVLFFALARRWPSLMTRLHHLEVAMEKEYGYPQGLATRCRIIVVVILSISFCEHFLSNYKNLRLSYNCAESAGEWMSIYFRSKAVCSLILDSYCFTACSVMFQHMSFVAVFSWNFMDLFVTLTSVMLTARLRQITSRLDRVRSREMLPRFWSQIREDYAKVVDFVRLFDEHINKIILLCLGNDLYFICLQLLHSIGKKDEQSSLYFCVSFGHLLLRTSAMGFFAAGVHDESKQPAIALFSVPSSSYTTEVERLMLQVTSDNIALTGSHFFSITKAMLLTLAGTIVTYEIVLVQLSPDDEVLTAVQSATANFTGPVNPLCPEKSITY